MADAPLTARSVTCTGVVVRFGETTALAGVSLSVQAGRARGRDRPLGSRARPPCCRCWRV